MGEMTAQQVKDYFKFMLDNEAAIKADMLRVANENPKIKRRRTDTKAKIVDQSFKERLERLALSGNSGISFSFSEVFDIAFVTGM